jgi:hypothetical protein
MTHTKGPWESYSDFSKAWVKSGTDFVCVIHTDYTRSPDADARLIACAPELLENFEKTIKLIEHIQEKHGLVYAVTINDGYELIKKAKGE